MYVWHQDQWKYDTTYEWMKVRDEYSSVLVNFFNTSSRSTEERTLLVVEEKEKDRMSINVFTVSC